MRLATATTLPVRFALCIVLPITLAAVSMMARAAELPATTNPDGVRHVLVLYSSFRSLTPFEEFERRFTAAVRSEPTARVEILCEFLDLARFHQPEYRRALVDYLKTKYSGIHIDAAVPLAAPAAQFVVQYRDELFPGTAIVVVGIDKRVFDSLEVPGDVTGVAVHVEIAETVALALALHPNARRVALVNGSSELEKAWNKRLFTEVGSVAEGRGIIDLTGLTVAQLSEQIASLPPQTVVLWGGVWVDADGVTPNPDDLAEFMSRRSPAPMYALFDNNMGHGVVGGQIASYARSGDEVGAIVRRVLDGEAPSAIPRVDMGENPIVLDWREVQRWHIDERRIPANAVVMFREATFWERYRWDVLVVAAVLLLQSLLLVTLARQRSKLRRSRNSLADRLRFEQLISDLTTRFSDIEPTLAEQTMRDGVASLRSLLAIDRASLLLFSDDRSSMLVNHTSVAPGVEPLPDRIATGRFPKLIERLCGGESIAISHTATDMSIDPVERDTLLASGVRSLFATSLQAGGETLGFLSLATLSANRTWSESLIRRLQMLANMFASVVLRLRDAEARISSESLSHAVLNSVSALVAVVDDEGKVLAVNAAWERVAREPGRLGRISVGVNYLEECDKAAVEGDPFAREAAAGLKAVIDGSIPEFQLEHKAELRGVEHWYVKTIEPLARPEGGAIVSHQDITERRRAEFEADDRRKQLAHVSRVSTMGELAASIAHELNQPLTGVLTNAQAAQRFMAADPPDLDEVRDILTDIVEDDKRAGEVIRRLRGMLKAGSVERVPLDVNELVSDVIKLVGSDAVMRSVRIEPRLTPGLPQVQGDRIQLQQVVLNLVINGMDAMKVTPKSDRRLGIATRRAAPNHVEIVVEDAGTGIERDHLDRLFNAFFTTKPDGMGMGLSIARTIIDAHEGTVAATNNQQRGATFVVSLPVLTEGGVRGHAPMTASAD